MSTSSRRKAAAPPYLEALARLEAERPADAAAIKLYTLRINQEAAHYRHRLAEALAQNGHAA